MLKIFQKIRQKLIEQNKVRSYFFYAVGEIILVVIGILIGESLARLCPQPLKGRGQSRINYS